MINLDATGVHFKTLNEKIRDTKENKITVKNCMGQRYVACGLSDKKLILHGTPGNALGAYLNGATVTVHGNAQDATGDTMNEGSIIIHGSSGDATGYAMRGGEIYVRNNVGYRAGIHMKAYKEKLPILVIGGHAGSFLGEYQAGGIIVVLGLTENDCPLVGYFCGTGMHGGKIFLRCNELPPNLPKQVKAKEATEEDLAAINGYLKKYCDSFKIDISQIIPHKFFVLTPNMQNPYQQLYAYN